MHDLPDDQQLENDPDEDEEENGLGQETDERDPRCDSCAVVADRIDVDQQGLDEVDQVAGKEKD